MPHFSQHYEENYLKALYKLSSKESGKLNNTALAKHMNLNPATVLEMVRKLADKGLVEISSDKRIQLTEKGEKNAVIIIRKHRLWEVFLVEKLNYKWNEVHDIAEQLEHIESNSLIDRLDQYLGYPLFDPHGDPIPDKKGRIKVHVSQPLTTATEGKAYLIVNLSDTNDAFLEYLEKNNLKPGTKIRFLQQNDYDKSCAIVLNKKPLNLSEKVALNILVRPV